VEKSKIFSFEKKTFDFVNCLSVFVYSVGKVLGEKIVSFHFSRSTADQQGLQIKPRS